MTLCMKFGLHKGGRAWDESVDLDMVFQPCLENILRVILFPEKGTFPKQTI